MKSTRTDATIDHRVLTVASEVLREEGRNGDDDYLLDALKLHCRQKHRIDITRAIAKAALGLAREKRPA